MKMRGFAALGVLICAIIAGGGMMQRGLNGKGDGVDAREKLFEDVLDHVRRDFVDVVPDSILYRHAIDGTLHELNDPHSVYLDPKPLTRLEENTTGHYAGVGIQMDLRDSGITVVGTLAGSSAEELGVQVGDRIVSIEGKSTRGLTSEDALKTLRGPADTKVHVVIERPGVPASIPYTFVRRLIEVNPVSQTLMLGDGVGFVSLTIFSTKAAEDLTHAIDSLRSAGARSLILDLRNDPGGLLEQGVGVSDLFLDPGQAIVSTRGRMPEETMLATDRAPQRWPDVPLIVLTDSGTASASEIVAGALQDHDRALIVGTTTYGKGSAQRVFKFAGGAVKLTTALWYTPKGRSIDRRRRVPSTEGDDDDTPAPADSQPRPKYRTDGGRVMLGGGGIVPDIEVAQRTATPADKALQAALGKNTPVFRDVLSEYALSLRLSHAIKSADFVVTPEMRNEFYRRLRVRNVDIPRAVFDSASPLITRTLGGRIERYVFGSRAELARQLHDDPTALRALELARGARTQKELLERALTLSTKK